MKNSLTSNMFFACLIACYCSTATAQYTTKSNTVADHQVERKMEHYRILKEQGFKDQEIFEDLGNANFLNENYAAASFWYQKLKESKKGAPMSKSYQKRYHYALKMSGATADAGTTEQNDWLAEVASDYQIKKNSVASFLDRPVTEKYRELDFQSSNGSFVVSDQDEAERGLKPIIGDDFDKEHPYKLPVAVTPDGNAAYFSMTVKQKPGTGIFSKKEQVHKIYRAEKVNGKWTNVQEIAAAPKHASAKHPAISADGKRLFFASNMPGSFGAYDIYVSDINGDGSLGTAKNLGRKVNTKENDVYPKVVGNRTLFFASAGRRGYGGLDVYMTQVGKQQVDLAVNLGSDINSMDDDFALAFTSQNGKAYVMSNRGKGKNNVERIAFTYADETQDLTDEKYGDNLMEALNSESQIRYTSSLFEDE
ncbi:TolB family protein [Euzebyella saccharophila]|uniref:PD40 domain-containing protein n=1 Tax=Euzebyella saccharophila TaxID=679664 RepID=A0ABV8JUY4_9FLAO|nr:PD40 domain-containing protein [Euzebyella saccharophila]